MSDPFKVVRDLEAALCEYTGAPFAVTTTSCTQAILMALAFMGEFSWLTRPLVSIPKRTYVGVPASVLNAGMQPVFRDEEWVGEYRLKPYPVIDSARRFTAGMYEPGEYRCVSFHTSKILGDSQGGAILHDNPTADTWLRRARFDGRTEGADPKTDQVQYPNWHAYMSPDVAARLLWKLQHLPRYNQDLSNSDYPELSTMEAFK